MLVDTSEAARIKLFMILTQSGITLLVALEDERSGFIDYRHELHPEDRNAV